MKDPILNERVLKLIDEELHGLDDFQKAAKLTELIEVFSQEAPAMLAEMRVEHVRRLTQLYTRDEIRANTSLSDSRIRKLIER